MKLTKQDFKKKKFEEIAWYGNPVVYKMLPKKISDILKSHFRKKLFQTQKGYSLPFNDYGDDYYFKIIEDFANENLYIKNNHYSKMIFGNKINDKEKVIKQYLLRYFYPYAPRKEFSFIRSIFYSIGSKKKLIYPLNKNIAKILQKKNINVNIFQSTILWYFFIITFFFIGCKKIFSTLFKFNQKNNVKLNNNIYFLSLPKEALNIKDEKNNINENYFSFIYSYIEKNNLNINKINHSLKNFKEFSHNKINFSFSEKFNINFSITVRIKFIVWSFIIIFVALFDIIRGRWWNPLMLREAVDRKIVELLDNESLHKMYLFNNTSGFAYKPMWTYEAKIKGSIILFYFYSLHYLPITKNIQKPEGASLVNWDNYAVWNKSHEKQLRNTFSHNFKTSCYKPVFFNTGFLNFNKPSYEFVTLFDVTPIRPIYRKTHHITEFYKTENIIKFINDTIEISEKYNVKVILKMKRFSSLTDKYYINYLNNQKVKKKLKVIDEKISSIDLIKKSKLILSYPLTSTNQLSNYFNVKNYYYCPVDININSNLLIDTKVIYSKDKLNEIFSKTF